MIHNYMELVIKAQQCSPIILNGGVGKEEEIKQ